MQVSAPLGPNFDDLALHDATLTAIYFDWAAGTCSVRLSLPGAENCELKFSGVYELIVPRREPWGPSVSVNSSREVGGNIFEIELQSGDILRVSADSWLFNEHEEINGP